MVSQKGKRALNSASPKHAPASWKLWLSPIPWVDGFPLMHAFPYPYSHSQHRRLERSLPRESARDVEPCIAKITPLRRANRELSICFPCPLLFGTNLDLLAAH